MVSDAFFRRELGGDPAAIGTKLTLARGRTLEIIGVTPPDFHGLQVGFPFDLALPLCWEGLPGSRGRLDRRDFFWLAVMGRLKPGWSRARAGAQLASISRASLEATLPPDFPAADGDRYLAARLVAAPGATGYSPLRASYTRPLALLLGVAGLVLLIACANLASLLLARASAREREIAVRLALGASRGRLVRQLMTESLLLATMGAALGLALAHLLSRLLVGMIRFSDSAVVLDLALDARVVGFTAGLAALSCVAFGLVPALRAARTDIALVLGRTSTQAGVAPRLRRALVVAQVALSFVLLLSALLFARSLRNVVTSPTGFDLPHLFCVIIRPMGQSKADVLTRLRSLPQVASASAAYLMQGLEDNGSRSFAIDGSGAGAQTSGILIVGPDYFATLGIPVLAGRPFDARDARGAPAAMVVSQAFARRFGGDVLGRRARAEATFYAPAESYDIVGVVAEQVRRHPPALRPHRLPGLRSERRPGTGAARLRPRARPARRCDRRGAARCAPPTAGTSSWPPSPPPSGSSPRSSPRSESTA